MKSRLLCVLVLLVFAMGCKDDKKKKDDDEKESSQQSTEGAGGGQEGGEAAGGDEPADASCADVYANMLKINGSEGAPSEAEFVANCEKESTPKQRACLAKAKTETDFGPCFLLGKAPPLDADNPPADIDAKIEGLKPLDAELARELEKAEKEFDAEMDKAEKEFDVEMKKIQEELESMR